MSEPTAPNMGHTEILGASASNPANPRSSGFTIFALDQEFTVSPLEQRIKAQLEQWVRGNILKSIEASPSLEQQERLYASYIKALGAGNYNWEEGESDSLEEEMSKMGSSVRQAIFDLPGHRYLFYLLLRRSHKKMTKDLANRIYNSVRQQAGTAISWALGNSRTPAAAQPPTGEKDEPEDTLDAA